MEILSMNCKYSILLVTLGMIAFTILCNSRIDVSTEFLLGCLFLLHVGMIWMVITILRDSKPPVQKLDSDWNDRLRVE
jgi:hypothetical protein